MIIKILKEREGLPVIVLVPSTIILTPVVLIPTVFWQGGRAFAWQVIYVLCEQYLQLWNALEAVNNQNSD